MNFNMADNLLPEKEIILSLKTGQPWDLRDEIWSRTAGSLVSDGVYMKTELLIDGINHYLKLSRYDSYRGIYGHESVNELIAYRLGKLLGFDVPEGFLVKCLVKIDDKEHMVRSGESIYIRAGEKHRLVNSGNLTLEVIEVQNGQYLGEDDIVRYEDDYER